MTSQNPGVKSQPSPEQQQCAAAKDHTDSLKSFQLPPIIGRTQRRKDESTVVELRDGIKAAPSNHHANKMI